MIDQSFLKNQLRIANELANTMKAQNDLIGTTIQEALMNAPEDQKDEIQKIQLLSQKAFNFAKEGNIEKAKEILNQYKNGRKNNKS